MNYLEDTHASGAITMVAGFALTMVDKRRAGSMDLAHRLDRRFGVMRRIGR